MEVKVDENTQQRIVLSFTKKQIKELLKIRKERKKPIALNIKKDKLVIVLTVE